MKSPSSSSSSPSEGEIIESDSDKATTATASNKGISVDRPFRNQVSVSRSPSPIRSPRHPKSRDSSRSRSPYREPRGAKRAPSDDHYDRTRNDPRRFRVRYEDRSTNDRSRYDRYRKSDHITNADKVSRYEGRVQDERSREKQPRVRSRSPFHVKPQRSATDEHESRSRTGRGHGDRRREQYDRMYHESRGRLSTKQSVSDRGYSPVAAARIKREAEHQNTQTQNSEKLDEKRNHSAAKCVRQSLVLQIR